MCPMGIFFGNGSLIQVILDNFVYQQSIRDTYGMTFVYQKYEGRIWNFRRGIMAWAEIACLIMCLKSEHVI